MMERFHRQLKDALCAKGANTTRAGHLLNNYSGTNEVLEVRRKTFSILVEDRKEMVSRERLASLTCAGVMNLVRAVPPCKG